MKMTAGRKEKKEIEKKKNKKIVGAMNEELAAMYLAKQGIKVIERNYRKKSGEIDIIAKDGDYLVFCEVKYRNDNDSEMALYSISAEKQKQIARIARAYMAEKHIHPESLCRFDCVLIDGSEIKHMKNAWML